MTEDEKRHFVVDAGLFLLLLVGQKIGIEMYSVSDVVWIVSRPNTNWKL